MTDLEQLSKLVQSYAVVQEKLLTHLHSLHPCISTNEPWSWPQHGELEVDAQSWRFNRHGAGFLFTSFDGLVVNAHEFIATVPFPLDAFRLEQYERSGAPTAIAIDDDAVLTRTNEIDDALASLCRDGHLELDARSKDRKMKSYILRRR